MTPEEGYMLIIWTIKAIGIMAIVIGIAVVIAVAHAPEYPNDDGEHM